MPVSSPLSPSHIPNDKLFFLFVNHPSIIDFPVHFLQLYYIFNKLLFEKLNKQPSLADLYKTEDLSVLLMMANGYVPKY